MCIERKCHPTASFYDPLQRDGSGAREVEPFCMAPMIKESSSGYLKKDCFMLRLELRIKSPSNESVTLDTQESTLTPRRTVFCKASIRKALLIAEEG